MQERIFYPEINGARFYAFLLVFLHHTGNFAGNNFFTHIGWTGVHFFFLLSGFLITTLLKQEIEVTGKVDIKKYLIRRILRIWPLYFLYLSLVGIFSYFSSTHSLDINRYLGNIFFIDNLITSRTQFNANIASAHLWSISLEEQYYLILPFLVKWLWVINERQRKTFFLLVFFSLISIRFLLSQTGLIFHFNYVTPLSGESFLVGIAIGTGCIKLKLHKGFSFLLAMLALGILFLLPYVEATFYRNQVFIYLIPAIAFMFFFFSFFQYHKGFIGFLFTNRAVQYLGKISFGLYIYHLAAILLTSYLIRNGFSPFHPLIVCFLITLLAATVSYELFEKKFLKAKEKFTLVTNNRI